MNIAIGIILLVTVALPTTRGLECYVCGDVLGSTPDKGCVDPYKPNKLHLTDCDKQKEVKLGKDEVFSCAKLVMGSVTARTCGPVAKGTPAGCGSERGMSVCKCFDSKCNTSASIKARIILPLLSLLSLLYSSC